jgi:hypothetical protein
MRVDNSSMSDDYLGNPLMISQEPIDLILLKWIISKI